MDEREQLETFKYEQGYKKEKAFHDIVVLYRERLYRIIRGFTNDHDDTDDILQETLVKAYENLDRFRGDSSLYTWLCRIAMNLAITHLRKKKLRQFISLDSVMLISRQSGPEQTVEENELKQIIQEAVKGLSEKQKAVFTLRYYDELSIAEVAEITGNSEGTIKANFFHAVNKIKKALDKQYFEKRKTDET
jgi:RNA polymerase sigma-70 factor (ECF subfamily)